MNALLSSSFSCQPIHYSLQKGNTTERQNDSVGVLGSNARYLYIVTQYIMIIIGGSATLPGLSHGKLNLRTRASHREAVLGELSLPRCAFLPASGWQCASPDQPIRPADLLSELVPTARRLDDQLVALIFSEDECLLPSCGKEASILPSTTAHRTVTVSDSTLSPPPPPDSPQQRQKGLGPVMFTPD